MTNSIAAPRAQRGRAAPRVVWAGGTLGLLLAGIADGFRAWKRYRRLRGRSDGELARMGLHRRDLLRHAVLGTSGEQ